TELQKRVIGEAKALRANAYLDLVSLWGDVPKVLKELAPSEWTTTGRAPKEEIYALIEQDLTEAIAVLPLKSAYSSGDQFRVSKGAAQALLGKAHLYQEKWSQAAEQFEHVITSGQYALESSIGVVFSEAGEFGRESILEISYNKNENYDWGNLPWDWRPESNVHIQLMGPRADFYSKAPSDSLLGGWGFNVPTEKLYQAFAAAGELDSERRWATLFSEAELEAMGGNWSVEDAYDFEGYFQRKYGSYASQAGGPVTELNYGTNWRLIRYADVLLMAAEAHYRAGSEPKAQEYINMVRERSELDPISPAGEALFQAIVMERQLELAFEGFRYIDLVRWDMAAQELGDLGFESGKHEVLPIPAEDIRTAGLQQNDRY
ncbi:MAG: RagB/SusD family nutrient uptake outer membrane protein, partial [Bacteroidetes bacterium]|nr:RagB/SusD family nutrient uptake outer membrane protein [Bacteroidota bacterium]